MKQQLFIMLVCSDERIIENKTAELSKIAVAGRDSGLLKYNGTFSVHGPRFCQCVSQENAVSF
jgi:hypothetical protein